ncbi:MAG: tetratricopeptide repeat protein [Limisphaerales bacterium]
MKKNLQIVAALLTPLCFALAQDDSQPPPAAPPPTPAETAPAAPTPPPAIPLPRTLPSGRVIKRTPAPAQPAAPSPAPTGAPAIDPTTGLPIDPKNPPPARQPAPQIDPTTGLPVPNTRPGANPLANGAVEMEIVGGHAVPLADGAFEEEGNLDLGAAMNSYQSVISRFDGERPEAANAIFRLGECYRKLGRIEEAKVQYARILREFPDQVELTKLGQKYLFEPVKGPPRFQQRLQAIVRRAPNQTSDSAGVHFSPNAKGYVTYQNLNTASPSNPIGQEKELIQQQIKLVQTKLTRLEEMQKKTGLVSDDSIDDVKMQLLSLQRELAAWEAKNTVREIVPPATNSGAAERRDSNSRR